MDILQLDRLSILSIHNYIDMFGSDDKKTYRLLLKKWHPDMNASDTSDVFVHINKIYNMKNIKLTNKEIEINGKMYDYLYSIEKDLYTIYYTDNCRGFLINFKHKSTELSSNYLNNLSKLKASISGDIEKRYQDLLSCRLYENTGYYKIALPEGYVPLNLLLKHINDFKDWKMSAYIISRIYDAWCLFNYKMDTSYIGCDPDFVYVNTKTHTIIDLSAMFFSVENNSNMIALTPIQASSFNKDDITAKIASNKSINNLVISIGLLLAGNESRSGNINHSPDANKALMNALTSINLNDEPVSNYEKWQVDTIPSVFTHRSFYKKEIYFNDLKKYI